MSFISIIATENFITVVTDGQVTKDGKAVENNYKKYKKISNNQFIAFGGAKEICETFIKNLDFLGNEQYDLQTLATNLSNAIKQIPYETYRILFVIGGLNARNQIEFYSFSNIPESQDQYSNPKGDEISYAFLSSPDIDDSHFEKHLIEYLSITGFNTPNKCIKAQKMLNSYVETIDNTVNKTTFELVIRK